MIKVGDRIPAGSMKEMNATGKVVTVSTAKLLKGKTVAIFGLPGAYTPVCSNAHLPGYVKNAAKLRKQGVDAIACISVNDPFVMDAWGKAHKVGDKIQMLADWDASFSKSIGMDIDLPADGLGVRSKRYSALVVNGVVKKLYAEKGTGTHTVCAAVNMLDELMAG